MQIRHDAASKRTPSQEKPEGLRARLRQLVDSVRFQGAIGVLIMLSSISLALETDHDIRHSATSGRDFFWLTDIVIVHGCGGHDAHKGFTNALVEDLEGVC